MTCVRGPAIKPLGSQVASELKVLLAMVPVGSDFVISPSADLCYSLELLIPKILRVRYPEWNRESLDGIFVADAKKTGPAAAKIVGTCILISDQTVTPFFLELAACPSEDCIELFHVRLGEPGSGTLGVSGPNCSSAAADELLASVSSRLDDIVWSYDVQGCGVDVNKGQRSRSGSLI